MVVSLLTKGERAWNGVSPPLWPLMEGITEPGGICISEAVDDQVRHRVDAPFEDMVEQEVKKALLIENDHDFV